VDYSELLLLLNKRLKTYQAAATLEQWAVAADEAAQMRVLATDLFLFAQKRADPGRFDRG
jgi:hypothetical protein